MIGVSFRCLAFACAAFGCVTTALCFQGESDDAAHKKAKYYLALGKTYNSQAHDHVRLLKKYASQHETADAGVVNEQSTAIRSNAEAAKRALAKTAELEKENRSLAAQIAQMQARLDRVAELAKRLESQTAKKKVVDSKQVQTESAAAADLLRENHLHVKRTDSDFYNSDSESYYTTGEGHFVD